MNDGKLRACAHLLSRLITRYDGGGLSILIVAGLKPKTTGIFCERGTDAWLNQDSSAARFDSSSEQLEEVHNEGKDIEEDSSRLEINEEILPSNWGITFSTLGGGMGTPSSSLKFQTY